MRLCVWGGGMVSRLVNVKQHDAVQRAAAELRGAGTRLRYSEGGGHGLTAIGAHSLYDGRQHCLQPLPGWLKCGGHTHSMTAGSTVSSPFPVS